MLCFMTMILFSHICLVWWDYDKRVCSFVFFSNGFFKSLRDHLSDHDKPNDYDIDVLKEKYFFLDMFWFFKLPWYD